MNYDGELEHALVRTRLMQAAITVSAVGAGFAAFFGLRTMMSESGAEGWIIPLVASLVIGMGLCSVWHKLIQLVPILQDPAKRIMGLALAGGVTVVGIAVSSWFIATGISGEMAVRRHMNASLSEHEEQLRVAYGNAARERTLVSDILAVAAQFRALADGEERGTLSGTKGAGPLVDTLRRTGDSYQRLAEEMEDREGQIDLLYARAKDALVRMRAFVDSGGSPAERQKNFAQGSLAFQGILTDIERNSMLDAIGRHGMINIEAPAAGGQRGTGERIKVGLHQFKVTLDRNVKAIKEAWVPLKPLFFSGINPGIAAITYAGDIAGAWTVAVAIEMLPMLVLLVLTLGHSDKRAPYQRHEPFSVVENRRSSAS